MNKYYYTDGACSGNPGPGGFGVVQYENDEIKYAYNEQCKDTTNNREETKAVIHVLKIAANDLKNQYIVYSDSAYVVNMCNNWIWTWAKNNWKNSKKKLVENIDLVKEIYSYLSREFFNVEIKKVKGHDTVIGNLLADAYATNDISKLAKIPIKNSTFNALD